MASLGKSWIDVVAKDLERWQITLAKNCSTRVVVGVRRRTFLADRLEESAGSRLMKGNLMMPPQKGHVRPDRHLRRSADAPSHTVDPLASRRDAIRIILTVVNLVLTILRDFGDPGHGIF
jgi:hypothetical protein